MFTSELVVFFQALLFKLILLRKHLKKKLNFKLNVLHFEPYMNRFPECIPEAITLCFESYFYKTDFYLI